MWNDQTTQQETAKALASHPDVDGIWGQNGEGGIIKAMLASGQQKLVPVTGENGNGYRLALINPDYVKRGLRGVSSGDPISTSAYAFKLMMETLMKKRTLTLHNIQYPLPWVTPAQIKVCTGDTFVGGCNVFPAGKVPDSFNTEIFNPTLTPEVSLNSALNGTPTPGATIQPLPADVTPAPNLPGINCEKCTAPVDIYKLSVEQPTVQP